MYREEIKEIGRSVLINIVKKVKMVLLISLRKLFIVFEQFVHHLPGLIDCQHCAGYRVQ